MFPKLKFLIAKLRIPKGDYCYKIKKIVKDDKYGYKIVTKKCPYYQWVEDGWGNSYSHCKYINVIDDILLNDQCKICGINIDKDPK